jgi:hypothetical protein
MQYLLTCTTWLSGDGGNTQNAGDPMMKTSLFDPEAPEGKRWRELAEFKIPRLYHSGVILLETGHVVTMGSEMQNFDDKDPSCFPRGPRACTSPYEYRLERFTPPYLLTGKQRPALSLAPPTLTYGSVFFVNLTTGIRITRASFIRYSTTTHNTNSDQRLVELEILSQTRSSTGESALYLKAPPNGEMAPPGHWMLFALADGVPSIAKTIRLGPGDPTTVEVPPDSFTNGEITVNPTNSLFVGSLVSAFVIFLVGVWI